MSSKNLQLPGIIARKIINVAGAAPGVGYFQPRFFPGSLPYQIDAIPEATDPSTTPEPAGSVFGVPPDASGDELPRFLPLASFLTHPRTLVYVGYPKNVGVASTGTAVAPFREISDAMDYVALGTDPIYEIYVAPGNYADFTVPTGKIVLLRASALEVASIAVELNGTLVFLELQTCYGQAPTISFPTAGVNNGVYFDPQSAKTFGFQLGSIVNGQPVCSGAGPYLALADSSFAAFDSAIASAAYHVDLANGTPNADTIGVIYPELPSLGSGACALVWPSGTIVEFSAGLGAGPLYRAANGSATTSATTQQIGNDDGARVYVELQEISSVPSEKVFSFGAAPTTSADVPIYIGQTLVNTLARLVDGVVVDAATIVSKLTCNYHSPLVASTTVNFALFYSTADGLTYSAVPGANVTISTSPSTTQVSFTPFVLPANSLVVIELITGGTALSGFPVSCTVSR